MIISIYGKEYDLTEAPDELKQTVNTIAILERKHTEAVSELSILQAAAKSLNEKMKSELSEDYLVT